MSKHYSLTELSLASPMVPKSYANPRIVPKFKFLALLTETLPRSCVLRVLSILHVIIEDASYFFSGTSRQMATTTTMQPLSRLELLQPEIQTLIVRSISVVNTLQSLFDILAQLGDKLDLQQDREVLRSTLSALETARIQRAFCRFEMYRHLFAPEPFDRTTISTKEQGYTFFNAFDAEEVEELACVRDYFVRRLWYIFDTTEDIYVAEQRSKPDQRAQSLYIYWYCESGKNQHDAYMERIMPWGLPLLQEIFTADTNDATNLILRNSISLLNYLSEALLVARKLSSDSIQLLSVQLTLSSLKISGEKMHHSSIGWLWGHDWKPTMSYGEPQMKGLRDWGYVFWDERRMRASRILDRWYSILNQLFDRTALMGANSSMEIKPYRFGDWYRYQEPSAMQRLENEQVGSTAMESPATLTCSTDCTCA